VALRPRTRAVARAKTLDAAHQIELNRALLEDAFPIALAVAALAVAEASVELRRVTVLGRIVARQLTCSDSILGEFVSVEDTQAGCVRFSAYTVDSALPRRYESAPIASGAPLFTSTDYGQPGYAQLVESADAAIAPGAAKGTSILTGAESGSEMGAFSAELSAVKEQGVLVKYTEYMPLGLAPVIVHAT
jgi:hypothetical protein